MGRKAEVTLISPETHENVNMNTDDTHMIDWGKGSKKMKTNLRAQGIIAIASYTGTLGWFFSLFWLFFFFNCIP